MTLNVLHEGSGHWTSFTKAEDSGKRTESDLGLSHTHTRTHTLMGGAEVVKGLAQGDSEAQCQLPLDPNRSDSHDPVVSCATTCPWQRAGREGFVRATAGYRDNALQEKSQGENPGLGVWGGRKDQDTATGQKAGWVTWGPVGKVQPCVSAVSQLWPP